MNEEFLHYIWRYRLYNTELQLTSAENLEVLHPGEYNTDSGPDFFNARVRIGDTLWAGNIEIHVNSSDWYRHNHHTDHAYDNLILHVVYHHDREIPWFGNSVLPTLELKQVLMNDTWQRYLRFMESENWIPCGNAVTQVDSVIVRSLLDRLLVERLERKSEVVLQALKLCSNDWNQAFFMLTARNMGFKLNNEAFERLASSLSYKCLFHHADNLFQLEAILFGQAGLLTQDFRDDYPIRLKNEYDFLRKKYQLESMEPHLWRYFRIHPGNFPTKRISQFAALIFRSSGCMMKLIEAMDIVKLTDLFRVKASEYWSEHYRFDQLSRKSSPQMGEEAVRLLMINLVVPFLFAYGLRQGTSGHMELAIRILESTPGETNKVIRQWSALGMDVSNAGITQSLLELKTYYCDHKKCLSCGIGNALIKSA